MTSQTFQSGPQATVAVVATVRIVAMSDAPPPVFEHDSFKGLRQHDRRSFLRRTLGVGSIVAAVAVGAVYLEDRHRSNSSSTTSSTTPSSTTTTGPAASWSQLAASLTGSLVLPSNPRYRIDRLLYNSKFVKLHPRAIAYCASSQDVARCLDFVT